MEIVTACTLDCPDACSLLVKEDRRGNIHIRGNPEHPVTVGYTCAKIRRFGRRLRSPNRITQPLLKQGEQWRRITWDEALDRCAEKIRKYRMEPASILHILGGADKGILRFATDLFFARLGSSRIGGCLCDDAGIAACIKDFGSLSTNDIRDLADARWIVNWGRDPVRSSIHVAGLIQKARKNGAQVLTISPGGDSNGRISDDTVRIRPGADRFLAAALIRLLVERDGVSQGVLSKTHNWKEFRQVVVNSSVEDLRNASGVSQEDLERVFAFYRRPEPVATVIGCGLQRHLFGGENVRFINALALLSDHIGRSGGGSYFNISSLRNLNIQWSKDPQGSQRRTLLFPTIGHDMLEAKDPPIRMLWLSGSNVVNQAPNSHEIARAFAGVEFKVVVDAFMTDTAERADLILPCKLMLEKTDLTGSYLHNFVHCARPAVDVPDGVRDDYSILGELGRRLDPPVYLPDMESCLEASLKSTFLETDLEELKSRGFAEARRPWIAYEGLAFDHPDGKYCFPEALHPDPPPPEGYPLRFLTLVRRESLHSQILPEEHGEIPTVWVGEGNPWVGSLDPGREAYVASPLGRMKVRLETLPDLHPEVVLYPRDDWMKFGGGPNQLIQRGITDMGDCTPFYQQYVRMEN
jgi:anaerobic selenocysteine-containing dehydrogenase